MSGRQEIGEEAVVSESPFGEVVISAYTRQQALLDGVLIDVTDVAVEAGLCYPTCVTRAVWDRYVKVPEGVPCQDEEGRLWDIVWMLRCGIAESEERAGLRFKLYVANEPGWPKPVTLKAVVHGGDQGEPTISIMLPEED
jgi:hypothetical protein